MNDETEDDSALFRDAMRGVKPLQTERKAPSRPPRAPLRLREQGPAGFPGPTERFSDAAVTDECPTHLDFHRGGIQQAVLRKLRQGKLPVENTLDLHGFTVEQARAALVQFLDECATFGHRSVMIVHGKGHRSTGNRPVIKPMVNRWLQQAKEVLAFCSAQPKDGGIGSIYVLLKRNR